MSEKFKTMPHSIEAEQSVLGSMLIDNEAPLTIFSALTGDDFYSAVNKKIYERMQELYRANKIKMFRRLNILKAL